MRVRFLFDGEQYSLYALELGDEHDYGSFRAQQMRDRPSEMATMVHRLERLAHAGVSRKKQRFNYLGDGIWEAKTRGGLRVTFFQFESCFFIIDSCFAKSQDKTPKGAIERAKARREAFLAACEPGSEGLTIVMTRSARPLRKLG